MPNQSRPSHYVYCEKTPSVDGASSEETFVVMRSPDGSKKRVKGDESDRETFRSERDMDRNEFRRRKFRVAIAKETECPQSSEELLMKKEERQVAKAALARFLSGFDQKDPARTVLVHVLLGTKLSETKELAARSGLSEAQVTAAKRKIERRAEALRTNFDGYLRRAVRKG